MTANARSLDEAVEALKRDPTQPVRTKVDDLTVELRAVEPETNAQASTESAADVLSKMGAWEGESLEELLAFFADARRQGGSRNIPDL